MEREESETPFGIEGSGDQPNEKVPISKSKILEREKATPTLQPPSSTQLPDASRYLMSVKGTN
jgi:hypothetical protein